MSGNPCGTPMTDTERIANLHAQRARLAAELSAVEDGTLPWIEGRSSTTPGDLAEAFGISQQVANNRLNKLLRVGLLHRWRVPVNGGGKAFAYAALSMTAERVAIARTGVEAMTKGGGDEHERR